MAIRRDEAALRPAVDQLCGLLGLNASVLRRCPAARGRDSAAGECVQMSENPWWHATQDDRDWDEPLPGVITLSPDYSAELPLWGDGFGNIDWRFTKFSPELLDRLAAWQRVFDENYHYETGWRSDAARDRWAHDVNDLTAELRVALGTRAEIVVDLWPLGD